MRYLYATAPELFYNNIFTVKADIWSLGVILYVMLFKTYPFKFRGENIFEYFQNAMKQEINVEDEKGYTKMTL